MLVLNINLWINHNTIKSSTTNLNALSERRVVGGLVALDGFVQLGQLGLKADESHFALQLPRAGLQSRLERDQVRDQLLAPILVQVHDQHCPHKVLIN